MPPTLNVVPPNAETPRSGASRIRDVQQFLADFFGIPTGVSLIAPTSAPASGLLELVKGFYCVRLTNKTGVSLAAGDVVAFDTTNDSAVALLDVSGAVLPFCVAEEAIAINATGRFALSGIVTGIRAQGTITRGHYIKKSATSLAVESTGTLQASGTPPPTGTMGLALTADSGGLVTALLFGATVGLGGDIALGDNSTVEGGGGTALLPLAGTLNFQQGNFALAASTAEQDLITYTVPANTFNADFSYVFLRVHADLPNSNTHRRTLRVKFAGTTLMEVFFEPGSNNTGAITAHVFISFHTGTTFNYRWIAWLSFRGDGEIGGGNTAGYGSRQNDSGFTADPTVDQILKVTGQSNVSTASDIIGKTFHAIYGNA